MSLCFSRVLAKDMLGAAVTVEGQGNHAFKSLFLFSSRQLASSDALGFWVT